MTLTIEDLDGKYRVTTVSDYSGPAPMKSDGFTEVSNGQTRRTDANSVQWTTQLTVISDHEVKLTSTADPKDAKKHFLLTGENGQLTNDPVVYTALLKVARKGDDLRLSGTIQHGKTSTVITMTKILPAG